VLVVGCSDLFPHLDAHCEDAVDESLKGHRSISQAKGHDIPLKGSIARSKCGLPFVTFSNVDQVVHMVEINFAVYLSLTGGVQEIGDQGEWVAVLFGYFVQPSVVDT